MESYDYYKKIERQREDAEDWLALKDSRDSQSNTLFCLSVVHSRLMLMRCGQHSAGSKNYWESPKEFNEAMLIVIEKNYENLTTQALEYMKQEENKALIKCEADIIKTQEDIKKAKGE